MCVFVLASGLAISDNAADLRDRLWHHRNLGKAYYENPMTQLKAVDEFKQALVLSPQSVRDQINYGLALLRAGMTKEAILQLQKAQASDPSIPHTWFNLGMAYKKEFNNERAIEQLEGMIKLIPDEPVTHYNLGVVYKLTGNAEAALAHFKAAAQLAPNFAAPHFQLYNAFREADRREDAARELTLFNEIKKRKTSMAVAEDPEWSFYAEIYDTVDLDGPYDRGATSPPLKVQTTQLDLRMDSASAGMTVTDVEGNGQPALIVWSKAGVTILRQGKTPLENTGLEKLKDVINVGAGDFNNDGLPDLAVLTKSGAALYVNKGGRFEESLVKLPQGEFKKAIWMDYDHDYDLDLVLLGRESALMRNEGSAGFSNQTSHFPFVSRQAVDAATFEMVPDTNAVDLAVLHDDGSMVVYHDKLLGEYEALPQSIQIPHASAIQALDIDNDGWTDLIAGSSTSIQIISNKHGKLSVGGQIPAAGPFILADPLRRGFSDIVASGTLFRNLGQAKFEKAPVESLPAIVALVQGDFDGDGQVEFRAITKEGSLVLMRAGAAVSNTWLEVRLEGVKNLKLPVGAVVEIKAGALYQKKTYAGVPLVFGLRSNMEVDTVRITWPNGLVQNEIKQTTGKGFFYKEKARLSGSCPMIFAWDGSHFRFITDVLGVAPLGASSGVGQYFPVNHREHILIAGDALKSLDSDYDLRITEELREVSYLDQVKLIAVDHKASSELFLNDKFKSPPFPDFKLYEVQSKIYPRSARDDAGHDVLQRILKRDDHYVDNFRRNSAGIGELHSLTLDFGNRPEEKRKILVLNGWVDWPDGSTFLAAQQESKKGLIFPYLQVKDAAGNWKTVDPDMGMPSGKAKSIVVDLTGKFLSPSREIRIVTNLCVYWDEIFLAQNAAVPQVRTTTLRTTTADLHYRGFSQVSVSSDRGKPEEFNYENWTPFSSWNPTPGLYTRYGNVRNLLVIADDKMVILGSGDELHLRFSNHGLPPVAPGFKRDFILLVDGWAKDSDANTAFAKSVDPLPFHAMKSYPYPGQNYPSDESHRTYTSEFNTRPAVQDLTTLRPQ
jgi:hypothetical protein